jgi:protein-tyrosine phosphatase
MKICFVCQGNIIRSPLAENVFNHLTQEMGLDGKYQVASAGTSAYHVGEEPDPRMQRVAKEKGLIYSGRAKQFHPDDFKHFDLIIAMDRANRGALQGWASNPDQVDKIRLMREFDPEGGAELDVPDPYYGGVNGFYTTFDIIYRSCVGLLRELEGERDSP